MRSNVRERRQISQPPANADGPDRTSQPFRLEPPAKGNVVRIVEFPPDKERNYGNQAEVFRQYGAEAERSSAHERQDIA